MINKSGTRGKIMQNWYFTFGSDHKHPNCYVRIHGTAAVAREKMFKAFGPAWAFQYDEEQFMPVKSRWGLTEIHVNPHLFGGFIVICMDGDRYIQATTQVFEDEERASNYARTINIDRRPIVVDLEKAMRPDNG